MEDIPRLISESLLMAMGTKLWVDYLHPLPQNVPVIVVSNHRSFLDAPILIKALNCPVRVACHHYMGEVPLLREMIHLLGCLPLDTPGSGQSSFLKQAQHILQTKQWIGIFPEGGQPMVKLTPPGQMLKFQRGFAHLAFSTNVPRLAVLPVAIASQAENIMYPFPISWLHYIDPCEPLFNQPGWHPVAIYKNVKVLIGHPYWITSDHQQQYQGKQARKVVTKLTEYCHQEITQLLCQGMS